LDIFNPDDELEQFTQLLLWIVEDVLEAEEVNRFVGVLSHVEPVLKP